MVTEIEENLVGWFSGGGFSNVSQQTNQNCMQIKIHDMKYVYKLIKRQFKIFFRKILIPYVDTAYYT